MTPLADLVDKIDAEELRRRQRSDPEPRTSREFRCPECAARCTRLLDGVSEAGHDFSCSKRLARTGTGRRVRPTLTDGGERR